MISDDDSSDIWVGRRFGSYRVEDILGRGTVSVVYKAVRPDGLEVALKVLTAFGLANHTVRTLFEQEWRLGARFDHPNVVPVDRGGEIGGSLYLEMPLIDGVTVADELRPDRRMSEARAAGVARQIGLGLEHVHLRHVVHRDVKPSNVLLDDERAFIFDFGLALDLDGDAPHTGRVYGSPMYLSPEQAAGAPVDGRADLYCLGATLYRMVAGRAPFYGDRADLLYAHQHEKPSRPVHVGNELFDIISWAMAKQPADRPQTGGELADRLACAMPRLDAAAAPRRGRLRDWFGA